MEHCSYEEFGRLFFEQAVSQDRIVEAVAQIAAAPIDLGPISAGPGGAARVTATGRVGEPRAERLGGDMVRYRVELPVSLDFVVDLAVDKHTFHGDLVVPLEIVARATTDLQIEIDVTPPRSRDVKLKLKASGLRASLLQKVGNIDVEVKRQVAHYVADELERPDVAATRRVDVKEGIEATWAAQQV